MGIFLIIVSILFILLIDFGVHRFINTGALSNVDVISFQISLLEIILATIALGGGILAFFGWKDIEDKISRAANDIKENKLQEIASRAAQLLKERQEAQEVQESEHSIKMVKQENEEL